MRFSNWVKFYKGLVLVTIVIFSPEQQLNAQGTQNILTIPAAQLSSDFKGTGNFNAIIFGNFASNSGDVEGRLAVGGNFNVATGGYSVGTAGVGVNAPNNTDNFIVNGVFSNTGGGNWGLRGNMVYNTAPNGTVFPSPISQGTITGGKPNYIVFSGNTLLDRYKALSTSLDGYTNNGSVVFDGYHQYKLTGTSPGLNVFDLTLPASMTSDEINITVPAGSTTIVNILNQTLAIDGGSMVINNSQDANTKVLFNFPNATSVTLKSYKFIGSFLAPKAALNGNGGSINGQAIVGGDFDQKGGFEFHNFDFTGTFDTPLPVNLVQFNAASEKGSVSVSWTTASESNSSHFDIERSANGKSWINIGTVSSYGESVKSKSYSFVDNAPANGENLYRLKMVDRDASFAYSRIISVSLEPASAISIFPNPAYDKIMINSNGDVKQVTLTDITGRKIFQSEQVPSAGIDCRNLSSGIYIVTIARTTGAVEAHKVLVKK